MTTQKIFASSTVIVILLVVISNNVVMASQSLDSCILESFENKMLVARDVIQQTIHDIQDLNKFINTIPRLKSLREITGQLPELKDCVVGLVGNMTVARLTLTRIRHLNDETMPYVLSSSKNLQSLMNDVVKLQGQVCHIALKDVDRAITSMLSRKLLDVAVIVDDIVYLVYQLQVPSAEIESPTANP